MKNTEAEEDLARVFQELDEFIYENMEKPYNMTTEASLLLCYRFYLESYNHMVGLGYEKDELQKLLIAGGSEFTGETRHKMNLWITPKFDALDKMLADWVEN